LAGVAGGAEEKDFHNRPPFACFAGQFLEQSLRPGESSVDGASGGQLPACSIRCRHGPWDALVLFRPQGAMSALGQKRTFRSVGSMSALPPNADMDQHGHSAVGTKGRIEPFRSTGLEAFSEPAPDPARAQIVHVSSLLRQSRVRLIAASGSVGAFTKFCVLPPKRWVIQQDGLCSPMTGEPAPSHKNQPRPGRSMRYEYRGGHSSQNAAGDTAKHELAQTRVAVAAHHNEIHVLISRM